MSTESDPGNPHEPPDDDELMRRVSAGDEFALRLLVDRWQTRVLAFLARSLGNQEEAEDLAQETFVRVYRNAGRYESRQSFSAWLFRIAGNLLRSRLRRKRVVRWLPLLPGSEGMEVAAPSREDPDRVAERDEATRALMDAIATLPERQRVAVQLKRIDGLSYREIADALGTSPSAVESLLVRALRTLRHELERRGFDG